MFIRKFYMKPLLVPLGRTTKTHVPIISKLILKWGCLILGLTEKKTVFMQWEKKKAFPCKTMKQTWNLGRFLLLLRWDIYFSIFVLEPKQSSISGKHDQERKTDKTSKWAKIHYFQSEHYLFNFYGKQNWAKRNHVVVWAAELYLFQFNVLILTTARKQWTHNSNDTQLYISLYSTDSSPNSQISTWRSCTDWPGCISNRRDYCWAHIAAFLLVKY